MALGYRFRYQGVDKHRVYLDCNYNLIGEPDSIMIDVYGNGNGHVLNFRIEDADGQLFSVNSPSSILTNQYGWRTLKAPLNKFGSTFNYPAKLTRITVYTVKTGGVIDSVYSGKILFDNLRIHNGIPAEVEVKKRNADEDHFVVSAPYPNPFGNLGGQELTRAFIDLSSTGNSNVEFTLYDLTGRTIHTENVSRVAGYMIEIDAMKLNLSSGVYLYKVKSGSESRYGKIVYIK